MFSSSNLPKLQTSLKLIDTERLTQLITITIKVIDDIQDLISLVVYVIFI